MFWRMQLLLYFSFWFLNNSCVQSDCSILVISIKKAPPAFFQIFFQWKLNYKWLLFWIFFINIKGWWFKFSTNSSWKRYLMLKYNFMGFELLTIQRIRIRIRVHAGPQGIFAWMNHDKDQPCKSVQQLAWHKSHWHTPARVTTQIYFSLIFIWAWQRYLWNSLSLDLSVI